MHAVSENQTPVQPNSSAQISISIEVIAYIVLLIVAVLIRVADLDRIPMTEFEAQQALAPLHAINPNTPGEAIVANSPMTYWTQLVTFTAFGANEFSARIGTVIAGVLLSLSPLLFRSRFGVTRTFIWSLLLTLLTIPVIASRYAEGTTWMMLFTVLTMWMVWRYWYSEKLSDAMWAVVFLTFMVLLTDPTGLPLLVILLVAGWLAVWRTAISAPERLDMTGDDILKIALSRLMTFPYLKVAFIPVLVVVAMATGFMLHPSGLSTVSQLINSTITGISQPPYESGIRLGLVALVTYEPLLIIFAIGGTWLLWKHGDLTYVDRFAVGWVCVGTLGLLLYTGARPAHAMWVVVPLTLLASYGITQVLVNRLVVVLWTEDTDSDDDLYSTRYWWVKWVVSLGTLMLLMIAGVHFHEIARSLINVPPQASLGDTVTQLFSSQFVEFRFSGAWFTLMVIIGFVTFLLVASFWGNDNTLQGVGIGFFFFLILSGIGGAWTASVQNSNSPAELWHPTATAYEFNLLRKTLFDIADRDSRGFPLIEVSVVTDSQGVITSNGLVAWLLRDFPNVNFVGNLEAVRTNQIVLMAQTSVNSPDLGSDYVGQSFVLRRKWSIAQLAPVDVLAWWTQRRFRVEQQFEEISILWLRQDVYNGIPVGERSR